MRVRAAGAAGRRELDACRPVRVSRDLVSVTSQLSYGRDTVRERSSASDARVALWVGLGLPTLSVTLASRLHSFGNLALGVRGLAAATVVFPLLAAQVPAPSVAATHACGLQWHDGDLWGVGRKYKVHFAVDGVEFTPSLGRAAQRNYPIALRARSTGRGAHPVALAPVLPAASDLRVEFVRGPITERYDVREDGVALSFVLEALAPGERRRQNPAAWMPWNYEAASASGLPTAMPSTQ